MQISLPYYRGHYFRDTPVTMSHWCTAVLTVFKIIVKDQNLF